MTTLVTANNGIVLDLDSLIHSYTYSSGLIATDSVTLTTAAGIPCSTFTQTYNYTAGNLTSLSGWVTSSPAMPVGFAQYTLGGLVTNPNSPILPSPLYPIS